MQEFWTMLKLQKIKKQMFLLAADTVDSDPVPRQRAHTHQLGDSSRVLEVLPPRVCAVIHAFYTVCAAASAPE